MKKYFVIFSLFLTPICVANELNSFVTDYCTFFPNGTIIEPKKWSHCCVSHDLNYWVGGTYKDMDEADENLKACVTKADTDFMGRLMYFGVRAGKKTPFRLKGKTWGNAWVTPRGLVALSPEEVQQIKIELENYKPVTIEVINAFIEHLNSRQN
jgi:hypothetical protein